MYTLECNRDDDKFFTTEVSYCCCFTTLYYSINSLCFTLPILVDFVPKFFPFYPPPPPGHHACHDFPCYWRGTKIPHNDPLFRCQPLHHLLQQLQSFQEDPQLPSHDPGRGRGDLWIFFFFFFLSKYSA
mgnify:CR=1 FL=1